MVQLVYNVCTDLYYIIETAVIAGRSRVNVAITISNEVCFFRWNTLSRNEFQ